MNQHRVVVLGAGAWGTALALVLARNGYPVHLWEFEEAHYRQLVEKSLSKYLPDHRLPENLTPHLTLESALKDVQEVLVVVPSHVFETTLKNLKPLWQADKRLAWATKGLIPPNRLAHEVVAEVLGKEVQTAVITGPTFANEVAKQLPSAVLIASPELAFAASWVEKVTCSYLHTEVSQDIIGAQIAGVVKNVLAIATGMCDG